MANFTGTKTEVKFEDRIPEVIYELPKRTDAVGKAVAELTARYAQAQAPIAEQDPRTIPGEPGDLKKSIHVGRSKTDQTAVFIAWYWFFVEYGTRYQSPHPFMRPALELARGEVKSLGKTAFEGMG